MHSTLAIAGRSSVARVFAELSAAGAAAAATLGLAAAASLSATTLAASNPESNGVTLDTTIIEMASHYAWGYRGGVKQPVGAYKDGLSVHQISKSIYPVSTDGNPDYLFVVDEREGTHDIRMQPTGALDGNVENPGGMVAFSTRPRGIGDSDTGGANGASIDGTLWFTLGGRAHDMPLQLYRSTQPLRTDEFEKMQNPHVACQGCTTPCISVISPKILFFYRRGWSPLADTTVRMRRYDEGGDFFFPEIYTDIGIGCVDPDFGTIGIEQLWTRHDPRFGYTMLTWQWFRIDEHLFGSNAFVYTDDAGTTWRKADGSICTDLPIDFSERDAILVPDDHLPRGETTDWHVRDVGVTPGGTFFMSLPAGDPETADASSIKFWRFAEGAWTSSVLAGRQRAKVKAHACGVTKDHVVFVYSESAAADTLFARISDDDGLTFSDPIVLDTMQGADPGDPQAISWVSFVQPADDYADNSARFFYAYHNLNQGNPNFARNYKNRVKWIKIDLDAKPALGDGGPAKGARPPAPDAVTVRRILDAWGGVGPSEFDVNGDGVIDGFDLAALLMRR